MAAKDYAKTVEARRAWRVRQDARISRCPGCDQWQWDGHCRACAVWDAAS